MQIVLQLAEAELRALLAKNPAHLVTHAYSLVADALREASASCAVGHIGPRDAAEASRLAHRAEALGEIFAPSDRSLSA